MFKAMVINEHNGNAEEVIFGVYGSEDIADNKLVALLENTYVSLSAIELEDAEWVIRRGSVGGVVNASKCFLTVAIERFNLESKKSPLKSFSSKRLRLIENEEEALDLYNRIAIARNNKALAAAGRPAAM